MKKAKIDKEFFDAFTTNGKFVQIYPSDTYKKFGELVDAFPQGVMIRITKSDHGSTYKVGSIHFVPMTKLRFMFISKEEATK